MRTTIDLPEATLRELKARAAMQGLPMKDLVTEFVRAGLASRSAALVARGRSPLPSLVPNKALAVRRPTNASLQAVLDEVVVQRIRGGKRGR
jgi:hypothetical protein